MVGSFFGFWYLYCFKTFKKSLETLKYNLGMKCPKHRFLVFEIWGQVFSAVIKYFSATQYIYIQNTITVSTCTYKHSYSDIPQNFRNSCHMSSTSWNMEVHRGYTIPFTPNHAWKAVSTSELHWSLPNLVILMDRLWHVGCAKYILSLKYQALLKISCSHGQAY